MAFDTRAFYLANMDGFSDDSQSRLADSNVEPLRGKTSEEDHFMSRYHWYGELYFKFILARSLFRNATPDMGYGELNVSTIGHLITVVHELNDTKGELTRAIIDFPYADCVEKVDAIQAVSLPSDNRIGRASHFELLMTKIGAVLERNGDSHASKRLAGLIETRGAVTNLQANLPPSPSSADGDIQLPLYTVKLREWCAKKSKSFDSSDQTLGLDPPKFEVIVRVDGEEFTGRARSEQTAKHLAAKEACERFDIEV